MSAYAGWDYVGAEGGSYPEVASRAIRSIHAQHRSPYYGYLRTGVKQKIYLFQALADARAWWDGHLTTDPGHDYAAVFAATNLRSPMPGMEHFARATVGADPYVGNWWPFLFGLPVGGLAGYFLRQWQEKEHPGQKLSEIARAEIERMKTLTPGAMPSTPPSAPTPSPSTSGDPYGYEAGYSVGAPWLDMVGPQVGGPWVDLAEPWVGSPWVDMAGPQVGYSVGAPWVDMIGPQVGGPWVDLTGPWIGAQVDDARRRSLQARALIQTAIDEVTSQAASYPAEAYVWTLDAPSRPPFAGRAPGSVVTLEGTTNIVPFGTRGQAIDYLREVARTRPVALAMFERSSRHWPNPVSWRKSDAPEHEQIIAQHVASREARASGDYYVGRGEDIQAPGYYAGADTVIGAAIDDVRRRAQTLAEKRAGNVIGVIHTSKDGLWHTLAFRTSDDADDWLGTATTDPAAYTYAAYYDKDDFSYPHPVNEKIGGARTPSRPGEPVRRRIATTSGDDASVGEMIGALVDDYRTRAKQLATARPGGAAGVIRTADGLWHALGFSSLDDSVDWLQTATRDKARFVYAAIFEKSADGTAYFQDEEVGVARPPAPGTPGASIRRGIATTSGDDAWWAA